MTTNIEHPCYNKNLINTVARIHIPVASECNMQCNYCNRNYCCPNETRPGVTSRIIEPDMVEDYIKENLSIYSNIKIAGIAGPGDSMADMEKFYLTAYIVKSKFPDLKLCIATNGLILADQIKLVSDLKVDFVTITINSLETRTITKIYDWIKYKETKYFQDDASNILLQNQAKALEALYNNSIKYKINTILIPGINNNDIELISIYGAKYGALAHNIMPLLTVKGSKFENLLPVNNQILKQIRKECSKFIKIIDHCNLCRSDAIGLLHSKQTEKSLINQI